MSDSPAPSTSTNVPILAPAPRASELLSSEIMIWEEDNPRSILNLVSPGARNRMLDARTAAPELFELDEYLLYKKLGETQRPTPTDNRIRIKFWMEYDECQLSRRLLDIPRIVAGICSRDYFERSYMSLPQKVAWLLCPPAGYMVKVNEALEFGLEQLRDILQREHVLPTGKVDSRLGELKAKIVMFLDARVKGAIVQKALVAHAMAPVDVGHELRAKVPETYNELTVRLAQLRAKNRELQNGGLVIETTHQSVSLPEAAPEDREGEDGGA